MSCSLWRYTEQCEGRPCPGDCDYCDFDPDEVTITPPTVDYKWEEFDDKFKRFYTLVTIDEVEEVLFNYGGIAILTDY